MKTAPLKRIRKGQKTVTTEQGDFMTVDNYQKLIPSPAFGLRGERWTAIRKDNVVKAIRAGFMSVDDAVKRWSVTGITQAEVAAWVRGSTRYGLDGLKVTMIQEIGDHAKS